MLILNLNVMNTACHNKKQQGADKKLLWVCLIVWSHDNFMPSIQFVIIYCPNDP